MKGYKATINMECKNFKYEVGKTYELEGELVICDNGFHFCKNQQDVLRYYEYCRGFILLEVEALGEVITDGDKSVTDKIRIVRIVPKEEWEFLEKGNVIRYRTKGFEWRAEYDENQNPIHYKIYYKNSDGYETWSAHRD